MSGDYTANVLADLNRLQGYSAALQNLMRGATFAPADDEQATDDSRTVIITVDAQGVPTRIRIAADWLRRLGSADLGAAITGAHQNALQQRMQAWEAQLLSSGWIDDLTEFQDEVAGGRLPTAPVPEVAETVPAPASMSGEAAVTRPLSAVAEDALTALDAATSSSPSTAASVEPQVEASVARGRIDLGYTRAGGLVATVDAEWAGSQSASMLMTYLDQALDMLRLKLSRSNDAPPASAPFADLDALLGEAMAFLSASR